MADDTFTLTDDDIAQAAGYESLGPAYFAAQRAVKTLMQGVESAPLTKIIKKCADDLTQGIYQYVEDEMRNDLELNLQGYIRNMVERTVHALLTGEEWAMKQYPLAKYHDGEAVRAAVAKHGGEPLLMLRIKELEAHVERAESLRVCREYR